MSSFGIAGRAPTAAGQTHVAGSEIPHAAADRQPNTGGSTPSHLAANRRPDAGGAPRPDTGGAPRPDMGGSGIPRAGSATATVEALYRKHHAFVFGLALRYGRGRKAWAEDVLQDVFVDLLRALPALHDTDALEGWLYRATTHRCFKRLRRERFLGLPAVRWLLGAPGEEAAHPEVAALARHDLSRAFEAVNDLPPKERVAFFMFHLDGKSQDEIGEVLGHKKSYVCKLIQRATDHLRALGWEVPDGAP